jgi:uncharacterized protein YggT (Ycf19 family)
MIYPILKLFRHVLYNIRSVYFTYLLMRIHLTVFFIIIIWFVRLLALRPLLANVPASGDSEGDCGEADGM